MPRPIKCRRIGFIPGVNYFKPAGIPMRFLEGVSLSLEEVEAIRLKDIEDLDQEQCAVKMNISRPTFQRILESARKKIAEALLNGKAIKIEGGNYEFLAPATTEYPYPGPGRAGRGHCRGRGFGGGF